MWRISKLHTNKKYQQLLVFFVRYMSNFALRVGWRRRNNGRVVDLDHRESYGLSIGASDDHA